MTPTPAATAGPRRRVVAAVLGAVLAGSLLALAPAPARPAPSQPALSGTLTAEEFGLEVEAGFQGQALRNTWMPVVVRLTPRSLLTGTLSIRSDRNVVEEREVEVAGGSTKEFTFVVPAGTLAVRVQPTGSDEAVQVRPPVDGRPAGALVGASPGLLDAGDGGRALPNVELMPTGERAVWVTADPALLERSHLVLSALSSLVMTPADLDALGELGRANLERAVLDGLNLVVVASDGAPTLDLPWQPVARVAAPAGTAPTTIEPVDEAWVLTAAAAGIDVATTFDEGALAPDAAVAAAVPAGLGRVAVTGLSPTGGGHGAAAGVWQHLLAERDAGFRLNGEHSTERGWIAQEALRAGGNLDVPSLGLLAAFALAYVLVVGPGNALLLKVLGRRELGWVTVPAITVAFIGLAAAVASGTQPEVGVAGGATTWVEGRGTDLAVAAVRAPNAGRHVLTLPGSDWQIDPVTAEFTGVATVLDRTSGDVRARLQLEALQVGTVVAHRPTDEAPPLQLTATIVEDGVDVEVTNTSSRAIVDTQIRVGGHHSDLRTLAPGEARTWRLDTTSLKQLEIWRDIFEESRGPNGVVESPSGFRALISGQALADRPGFAVVVGDDPDAGSSIGADGSAVQDLGRVVAVVAPVTQPTDGDVVPVEATRTLLVGGFQEAWQPSPHAVEGQLTAVLRYRLPARAAGRVAELVTDLRRGQGQFEGGIAMPMPDPVPGKVGTCVTVETRSADGSTSASQTCSDEAFEPPPCPEDAVACDIGQDFWLFEFEDGTTVSGQLDGDGAQPMPFGGQAPMGPIADALEVFDHEASRWERLADAAGPDGVLSASFVSPFGEVHVRASGGLFPFDFSARGMGARLTGASA